MHAIYAIIVVLLLVFLCYLVFNKFRERLTHDPGQNHTIKDGLYLSLDDQNNDKFKVQYLISGLENMNATAKTHIIEDVRRAAETIEQMIIRTTPAKPTNVYGTPPGIFIKDVFFDIKFIDIGGKLIAQTGIWEYEYYRNKSNDITFIYPTSVSIELDKSNAEEDSRHYYNSYSFPWSRNKSRLYYLLVHEMLHGLGVGGMWLLPDDQEIDYFYDIGLLKKTNSLRSDSQVGKIRNWIKYSESDSTQSNPYFSGPSHAKYNNSSATNYYYRLFMGQDPTNNRIKLPLEDDGDGGTRLWHWEQGAYQDDDGNVHAQPHRIINGYSFPSLGHEVMVGWDLPDLPPVISTITLANLEDLGYDVDYSQADISTHRELQRLKGKHFF